MRAHEPVNAAAAADITADAMAGFKAFGAAMRAAGRALCVGGRTVWMVPGEHHGVQLYGGTLRFAVIDGAGGVQITGLTPMTAAARARALIEGGGHDAAAVIAWHCMAVIPLDEVMPRYEIVPCEGLLPDGTQLRMDDSRAGRRMAALVRRHRRSMDMQWRRMAYRAALHIAAAALAMPAPTATTEMNHDTTQQ